MRSPGSHRSPAGTSGSTATTSPGCGPTPRAKLGLVRTFQSLELFEDLTVRDNLLVAADRPKWYSFLSDIVRAESAARRPRSSRSTWRSTRWSCGDLADKHPSDLSRTASASWSASPGRWPRSPSCCCSTSPPPASTPQESQLLGAHLRSFLDLGVSLFLIDHDMGLVLNVCDYIYVLDFGRVIAHGTPARSAPTRP